MSYANARLITVAAAAFLFTGVGATAQAAPSNGQGQAASERKICVETNVTGTRVSRKVCRTEAEWIRTEGAVPATGR